MTAERMPVDVLAALRAALSAQGDEQLSDRLYRPLCRAHAAVAELMDATSNLIEVSKFAAWADAFPAQEGAHGPLPRTIYALARCKGSAP